MPATSLDTTPGSPTANAYVSIADADQYFLDRPFATAWAGYTSDQKTQAILFATKLMDSMFKWSGWAINASQVLSWPRTGMWTRNGFYIPNNIYPNELKWATAEYARQLILADRSLDSDIETQGITALSAGPVSLSFKDSVVAKVVPDVVVNLIPPEWGVLRSRQGSAFRRVTRY